MNKQIIQHSNIKFDCFNTMPKVIYVQRFDEKAYDEFSKDFNIALDTKQEIIPIVVDSFGGDCSTLLGMVSIIENSPVPVATITETKAMSCGAVLFACGTKGFRFISPLASIMIHQVSSFAVGKVAEIKSSHEYSDKINNILFGILDQKTGNKSGFWRAQLKEIENGELFLDAKNARKMGLADHIKVPEFKVYLEQKVVLE